jgi:hypothetical protein
MEVMEEVFKGLISCQRERYPIMVSLIVILIEQDATKRKSKRVSLKAQETKKQSEEDIIKGASVCQPCVNEMEASVSRTSCANTLPTHEARTKRGSKARN